MIAEKVQVPLAFNEVARHYDLLTGANPGYHRHLRLSARRLRAPASGRVLDLCCGTGASTAAIRAEYPDAEITGLDASKGMLDEARSKPHLRANFLLGDASDPAAFGAEGPYDGILMAYGIRNLSDPDAALSRILALLRPGGTVVFHEYSVADSRVASALWEVVCRGIIIPAGWVTSPGSDIYRYLYRSVKRFDGVAAFEQRLWRAGFVQVQTLPMDGWQRGVVHSFRAQRRR